jgi:hypothetical protein
MCLFHTFLLKNCPTECKGRESFNDKIHLPSPENFQIFESFKGKRTKEEMENKINEFILYFFDELNKPPKLRHHMSETTEYPVTIENIKIVLKAQGLKDYGTPNTLKGRFKRFTQGKIKGDDKETSIVETRSGKKRSKEELSQISLTKKIRLDKVQENMNEEISDIIHIPLTFKVPSQSFPKIPLPKNVKQNLPVQKNLNQSQGFEPWNLSKSLSQGPNTISPLQRLQGIHSGFKEFPTVTLPSIQHVSFSDSKFSGLISKNPSNISQAPKPIFTPKVVISSPVVNKTKNWLESHGLGSYIDSFIEHGFDDMEYLKERGLDHDDFELLGIQKVGHVKKLKWMIENLKLSEF